jgi:spermidine synthase
VSAIAADAEAQSRMAKKRTYRHEESSPWLFGSGSIREFLPTAESHRSESRAKRKRPFILETALERHLLFSHDSVQSSMRLDDPDALTCEYTRRMMAFLLFNPDPREILMIGLGGGSLAKFCYRHLRDSRMTAVEIDADVIALRDEFCLPFDDERFRVVHADGARYLADRDEKLDVILVDAFDHEGVAPTLASSEFYRHAAARLSEQGVLVMNLSGEPTRYDAHLQRIYDAFGDRAALVPVCRGENELMFAFKRDVPFESEELKLLASTLERTLSLDFPRYRNLLASALRAEAPAA